MLFGCGIYFGFRGCEEHVLLEVKNIDHGSFPSKHPFHGHDYYGIQDLVDKGCRLSIHKDYIRDTHNAMRIPVMDDDPTSGDFGGCIHRFLNKLSPGQMQIYCKVIPPKYRSTDAEGNTNYFYGQSPIGKHQIAEMFKEGAQILGLKNPEKFCAHSLRAYFITMVSSGEGVNDEERLVSARHESLGASAIYQERNSITETNKFASMGIRPKKQVRYE